ncbi:unnamed protein product [Larinioides sclopetarius]|uniref:Uncharacterized protein n=1 Tax=Larinioides sclopetarius TaxID=280406 RepID=A0AAV2B0R1_9ARAC
MFGLNEVQNISSDGIALKRFVTREPISLFGLTKNAKNNEEKEKIHHLLKLLKNKLPNGFKIGAAVSGEDSFFDSVAQGLNELQIKGLITGSSKFSVKSLRKTCKQYAQQVKQSKRDSWFDSALKGEGRKVCKYIRSIEFTVRDVKSTSSDSKIKIIRGRPEIEGKLICEKYEVKMRIIELRDEEIEGFVFKSKLGAGKTIIYIVNYRNHFVPLLSNIEKNVKRSIKVCREEVYRNVISSNSKKFPQSFISTLFQDNENLSHKLSSHSKSLSKEDHETSKKPSCSIADHYIKAQKNAHLEVNIVNEIDIVFPSDEQKENKQDKLLRKRGYSIKDNKAPKRIHVDIKETSNEYLEFSNDLHIEFRHDELENSYQINRCIPHQLLSFMYQLDVSVLCLVRSSIYKYKHPSLSLAFRDYEINKFGIITLCYETKLIHIHIESVEKYFTDNNINYGKLFNKEKGKQSFCMNNYFDSFVRHLISKLNGFSNYIEYLIIYTNSSLDFTEEMKLKPSQSRHFYPFKFEKMNIDDCDILKDFLFTNDDVTGRGFYQFSKNKTTREELLKHFEFSFALQKEIEERKLYPEFEKEIKKSFLDKLVFAVNQPNREELNAIVKNEINSKIKANYIELQEKILYALTAQKMQKKQGNDVHEILFNFSLLKSFLHDMFSHENIFSINLKGKGNDISTGITINYKDKITYVRALYSDSNIGYSHLFPTSTQKRMNKFSINKHFINFIEELEENENIRYFIIYTNAGLNLTEENRLKKGQSKDFYPLKLHKIDFRKKKYKIFRHCSCVDKNGLYQFSQEEATILSSLLKFPPFFQRKRQERLSDEEDKKYIKEKFLNKLIFAVNQPHRQMMSSIMKNEIGNKCDKVPYNNEELHETALRSLESQEYGPITKERMEKLLADIKSNRSSYQRIQNKNISEEIKFAKSVVGMEGTPAFNQFLNFLIKGEGIKCIKVMRKQGINLPSMSSILNNAGNNATKAFSDLYNLWFDTKGNKTLYLKTLEDKTVNLASMSSILSRAGSKAAVAFKDLHNQWFDAKGNKTLYLRILEKKRVNLPNISSILRGAGADAAKTFKDLYDLWFDVNGNKTQYLKTLDEEGVNLSNMSSILQGAGFRAVKAFKDLYDLWFDAKGNKTLYLKTIDTEGINMPNMSGILNKAGSNAAKAFKDLHNLWFDAEGRKTTYLKTLENEGVNLSNMSSILNGAGFKAGRAFKDLYDLWFDVKGNKTLYLKTLEDEGVNLSYMSSILHLAGSKAGKAFKDLYNVWFDAKGNKTLYLKILEDEGVYLPNMSSILNGAGCKAAKAFKDLYHLWFDAKGNKTKYLKTLEDEGINLPNMFIILQGAGFKAGKAFKDLYDLWFDAKGNKTQYLKNLDTEGVNMPKMFSILHKAGSKAAQAFEDLHNLWFDANGKKTPFLKNLEDEGVNLPNMFSILYGAGSKAPKAFKDLYDLWFDAKGNKTWYLKTLEHEGVNLLNMSSILNGAGSEAGKDFKDLYNLWFNAKGKKTLYLRTLE